jgi:galactokinase
MAKLELLEEKIKNGSVNALVDLYGSNDAGLKKQAARYLGLLSHFRDSFGNREVELFSSPGRTEIGGNHTDHNHGRVLAGAVNLDNIAVAAINNSETIRIESTGYKRFDVDLNRLQPDKKELFTSAALVRGICSRLKEAGFTIGGFDACIDGGVPVGSGLSSSASFEVLAGTIISHLFNNGRVDPLLNAITGQYAENIYFGKPCGLMDQTACAMGGLIAIDFREPADPVVKKINFDFSSTGFALVITDTGGNHADLNEDYASLPTDMKNVASRLGAKVLRDVTLGQVLEIAPVIRQKVGDRAILRSIHFHNDNQRVVDQVKALEKNDFKAFLKMVVDSGYSSFMYNQNIYPASNVREQGVSLALALSEIVLKDRGAWRVHGGGFAGTIQAFVPGELLPDYISTLEHVFGTGACRQLVIRDQGACRVDPS